MSAARTRRREGGSASLELAIIGVVLILLIFFAIQAALYFYGRSAALSAAREGVSQLRLASDRATYTSMVGRVDAATVRYAHQVGGQALRHPSVTSSYDDDAGTVTVQVSGDVVTLIPMSWSVTQSASGTVERFREP